MKCPPLADGVAEQLDQERDGPRPQSRGSLYKNDYSSNGGWITVLGGPDEQDANHLGCY